MLSNLIALFNGKQDAFFKITRAQSPLLDSTESFDVS
jgi:hypothetical protein